MTTTKKIDIWPTISSVLLITLLIFIFVSQQKSTDFKTRENRLKIEKDSIQSILDNRQLQIDSLSKEILNTVINFDTIQYKKNVIEKIKKQYEKKTNIIISNSVDNDIKFLTEQLSK